VLSLLALLLFVLLRQHTFYGPDGRAMLKMTMGGMQAHPLHPFYVPLLRASHALVGSLGGSWYQAGVLLSQVGAALAVITWHRAAARLGATRAQAAAVAVLGATAPAVLFFASVVELHAPFLAFAGFSTLAAARLAKTGTPGSAVGLGVATGLAVGAHATAHLLPLWLLPLVLAEAPGWSAARRAGLLGSALVVHAGVSLALPLLLRLCGVDWHPASSGGFLADAAARDLQLAWVPNQVWRDWLLPFAPLSVSALLSIPRRPGRGLVLLLGVAASLAATFVLMAPTTENGAYLVPLAWPAAWLVVTGLRPLLWALTAAGGLALGWSWIERNDDPDFGRAFVRDLRAEAAGRPQVVICGQHREFDACLIFGPELAWRELINEAGLPPDTVPFLVEHMRQWVAELSARGESVLVTEGTLQYLQAPVGPEQRTGPRLRAAIEQAFMLEPVRRPTLRAWRLHPR